jgi:hypothetical protein
MNHGSGRRINHSAGQLTARHWRRPAAAAAVVTGAMLVAGCGHQIYGAQPARAPATAAPDVAVAANSGCVQATPVIGRALAILQRLQRGGVTAAGARPVLAASQADISKLARTTSDTVLQENFAEISDAFTAFEAVMLDRNAPAYQTTFSDLHGKLAGFRRICSVGNSGFGADVDGWTAANGSTVLSRSPAAHEGRWSLKVTNAGTSTARTGFTDSQPWVSTTLKGSEQIGLWARAITGAPTLALEVRELSGSTVVGSKQLTMKLGPAFRFGDLTYKVKQPGQSRLSVTVWATGLAPGASLLVDDITIVRA